MMPIGPAPVISTSSPTRLNDSAVCVALPKGSKIDARSSEISSGILNALNAGITRYSANAPSRLTPTPTVFRHRYRLLRPLVPLPDVDVGAADGGLADADQNVVVPDLGLVHLDQLQPGPGRRFRKCLHRFIHGNGSVSEWRRASCPLWQTRRLRDRCARACARRSSGFAGAPCPWARRDTKSRSRKRLPRAARPQNAWQAPRHRASPE